MKSLTLTIGERVAAVSLLNDPNTGFSKSTLAFVLEDIKNLVMSDEDWATADLVKTPSDEAVKEMTPEEREKAQQVWKWNEEGNEKEIDLNKETVDTLVSLINKKSDAGEMKLSDGALMTLQDKLEAA